MKPTEGPRPVLCVCGHEHYTYTRHRHILNGCITGRCPCRAYRPLIPDPPHITMRRLHHLATEVDACPHNIHDVVNRRS